MKPFHSARLSKYDSSAVYSSTYGDEASSIRKPKSLGPRLSSLGITNMRASYHDETFKRFTDSNLEKNYVEESWRKIRSPSQQFYIMLFMLNFLTLDLAGPWFINVHGSFVIMMVISTIFIYFTRKDQSDIMTLRIITKYCPIIFVLFYLFEAFQESKTYPLSVADWFVIPIILDIQAYFSPCVFEEIVMERILLVFISFAVISIKLQEINFGYAVSFIGSNAMVLKQFRDREEQDRYLFLERHLPNLHNQQFNEQVEKTLVRNALKLTFPENPFHDVGTETRIEKIAQELEMPLYDIAASEGLVLDSNSSIPRYYKFLSNLNSTKVACYKHHGDPVIVHSITDLVILEDNALKEFIQLIRDASNLPEIPGLLHTVGYCLTPCTFVVEDYMEEPLVTLKDLTLELGAENLTLDWCFFKPLAACLARTLSTMHRNSVLHRHISLNTILLADKESCVLLPVSFYQTLPEVQWKLGHLWEVAPEKVYSEASDVWALCVVCWEVLVGPFHFQVTPLAMPPTVPKDIISLIMDGLSSDPEGRPTMDELYERFSQKETFSRESVVASATGFERVLQRLEGISGKTAPLSPKVRFAE